MQAPYNPEQAALTQKYPPILGGRPNPSPGTASYGDRATPSSSGMLGGPGEAPPPPVQSGLKVEGPGGSGSGGGSSRNDSRNESSGSLPGADNEIIALWNFLVLFQIM